MLYVLPWGRYGPKWLNLSFAPYLFLHTNRPLQGEDEPSLPYAHSMCGLGLRAVGLLMTLRATVNPFGFLAKRALSFSTFGSTRVARQPHIPAIQRIGPHNEDIISVIVGNLLGDGWAEKRAGNTRFHIHMGSPNVEYLMWLHKFYSERGYCSHLTPVLKRNIGPNNKVYYSYKFRTWTYSNWNWIYDHFYAADPETGPRKLKGPGNITSELFTEPKAGQLTKVVPSSYVLNQLLTPLALAVWILDDGVVHPGGLIISTYFRKASDVVVIQEALKNNFDLVTSVVRVAQHGLVLQFPKNQLSKLSNIVKFYMVPSMYYKLNGF